MSRNILLTLKFDGTAYHGWQLQSNAVSVQQRVNEAVNAVLHENINASGCSRTDTGVHAQMFCCNFHTEKSIPAEKLIPAVNYYLPDDIAVYKALEVAPEFHARFSCKSKEYVYRICNTPYRDPFYEHRALFYPPMLNEALLNEEIQAFVGYHDFTSFCSSGGSVEDKRRTVYAASAQRSGDLVDIRIHGDGFLYNMVRIIVGTLLYVHMGKIARGTIPDIIKAKDRTAAGITAPPQGLYLNRIYYDGVNLLE
ncbi:MAG: tRNA pseudouridine(38-40) synthase TruA [Clostridia bacterium]|nr:tRNA pseudouridine(38-40) synthase TruA [Clostridia bacterium]